MPNRARTTVLLAIVSVVATALAGCGINSDPLAGGPEGAPAGNEIVVGSANFTENKVLAELYAQAMVAEGVPASTHLNIGARDIYIKALQDGSISVIPEYTGNLLQHLDPDTAATTAKEVETGLARVVKENDLAILETTEAVDQDVYVVTPELADQYGLTEIGDLSEVPDVTLGGPTELEERPYGPAGLKGIYQVEIDKFVAYDSPAIKVQDLKEGKIEVATFFTTDSAIHDNGFVMLEDPQAMILPQNIVPLVRPEVTENTTAVEAMNAVGEKLTTEGLSALNRKVDVDHESPADVAAEWLKENELA